MAENTGIEWCHHTGNIWHGCTECSAGCDNCYARVLNHRYGFNNWGNDNPRRMIMSFTKDMQRYQKIAQGMEKYHRVFVGSMMDIFEKPMPIAAMEKKLPGGTDVTMYPTIRTDVLRNNFFDSITRRDYDNLMLLLLTKRPSNIKKYIPKEWLQFPPANVMYGTSPVNQATADTLIPQLLDVPGKHFLSMEPLIGPVLLRPEWLDRANNDRRIDWVIVGGESGHGRRPFDPAWARDIRDQCAAAGVPFFMKQWDQIKEIPNDLMIRQFPEYHTMRGKTYKAESYE